MNTKTIIVEIEVFDNTEIDMIENAIEQGLNVIGCNCMIYVSEKE